MSDYGKRIQSAVRAQIRAEIAAAGLKQADISRMTGIDTGQLSKLLNDKMNRDISYVVMADISKALGLTVPELAERAERRLEGQGVA
jgi:transcriptional regulator with XRE-family HTH domain